MSIPWDKFEPQGYEDMVSVLLSRIHPDAQRIDGKGGDGGRDVQIVRGQDGKITDAFELKSFTCRMTPGRRNQVARSLKRAADLGPARWTLVTPIDPTPGELSWFHKLGANYCFPIAWFGKTWLDGKMAEFPDIRRYFLEGAKDEVYRLLFELQKEKARLTDVPDAVARSRTLRERLNEIDPYYSYEISTGPVAVGSWPSDVAFCVGFSDVRVDAYPKYSGAVEDRPVTINVMLNVGPDDEIVLNALGYGLEVSIPPRMIGNVTIDAPSGLGGSFTPVKLNIFPTNTSLDDPLTIALDIVDGDRLLASCPVHLTEQTGGLKGSIFSGTDSTGWLETRLTLHALERELQAEFRLNPKPAPAMPAALVPIFRWLDACQPPHYLKIRWHGEFRMGGEISGTLLEDESLGRVVEALAYLQETSGRYWEMPPSLTREEGREIVVAATLLKGESIDFTWSSFNLTLNQWEPKLKELVNGLPRQFKFEQEISLDLEGIKTPIGRVRTYFESARLANPESVQQALTSGVAPHLRLVPGDSDKAQRVLVC